MSKQPLIWTKLGTDTSQCNTLEEVIQKAGLDYEVALAPLFAGISPVNKDSINPNDSIIRSHNKESNLYFKSKHIPKHFSVFRKDTEDIFGLVGSKYTAIQNIEALSFVEDFIGYSKGVIVTAGALGLGERVFLCIKLPEHIKIMGDDIIEKYLLITNSHNGTESIQAALVSIRIVCNNQIRAARKKSTKVVKIKHTKSAKDRIKTLDELIGLINIETKLIEEEIKALVDCQVKDVNSELKRCFAENFCTEEQLKEIKKGKSYGSIWTSTQKTMCQNIWDYYNSGVGQNTDICKNTAFGIYSAFSGYFQNVHNYNGFEQKFNYLTLGSHSELIGDISKTLLHIKE